MTRPADRVVRVTARCFGADVAERVFEPLVADWQREMTALPRGLPRVRSWMSGGAALLITAAIAFAEGVAPWRHDAGVRRRTTLVIAAFASAGALILTLPYLRYLHDPPRGLVLLALLAPSSASLALSFALLPAGMLCGSVPETGLRARRRLYLVGLVCAVVALSLALIGWIGPIANQAWREAIFGRPIGRGIRELLLPELWGRDAFADPGARNLVELRVRLALVFAWPASLAILGWRLGRHRRASSVGAMTFWWIFAAVMIVATEPTRHVGRELPWLLMPVVWVLAASALGPRKHVSTDDASG
jgi:hypothetical protein